MALKFPRRWPWSRLPEPPDPRSFAPNSILLASEGKRISAEAVEFTYQLSRVSKAPVHVFMIARIWGSAFGVPHPGLMPTKREWQLQHDLVAEAVGQLKSWGCRGNGRGRQQPKRRQAHSCRGQAAPARCHRHGGASAAPLVHRRFYLGARSLPGATPSQVAGLPGRRGTTHGGYETSRGSPKGDEAHGPLAAERFRKKKNIFLIVDKGRAFPLREKLSG